MHYLENELPGRLIMILGALSTIALIILAIWIVKRYNKKRKKERLKF